MHVHLTRVVSLVHPATPSLKAVAGLEAATLLRVADPQLLPQTPEARRTLFDVSSVCKVRSRQELVRPSS